MTDETQTDASEAPAQVPVAAQADAAQAAQAPTGAGYVLTRRDRTAIHFIDWAVRFGTPEFQERYRPVSDELFTHVYIDPTAKPSFVPPALVSVEQLNAESDPLEIIRSHLGLVIDDRQTRDKVRVDMQAHLEETERDLAETRAREADLDERLTATTARLQAADARVVELGEQLEAEVSGLHTNHAAELAATLASHEASVTSLTEERDRTLAELAAARDADVAALTESRDSEVARLEAQLENDTAAQRAEHETLIASLQTSHAGEIEALAVAQALASEQAEVNYGAALAALEVTHAGAIAALQGDLAAAIAAAEATTVQLKEARLEAGSLTAQRDRAIAEGSEWRNRLQQTVAALATSVDVGEWTNDNAPDERLISFIEETQLGLVGELEQVRATLDEVEEVATAQLVDEEETSDYAIGANDAAVLVLNALYGSADEEEGADVSEVSSAGGAGAASVADDPVLSEGSLSEGSLSEASLLGASLSEASLSEASLSEASLSEVEEADAEFEAELADEVDVEFENEDQPTAEAAIGHTAVIEYTIARDQTPEIDDVDKLGSLFDDDDDEASDGFRSNDSVNEREHRRAS